MASLKPEKQEQQQEQTTQHTSQTKPASQLKSKKKTNLIEHKEKTKIILINFFAIFINKFDNYIYLHLINIIFVVLNVFISISLCLPLPLHIHFHNIIFGVCVFVCVSFANSIASLKILHKFWGCIKNFCVKQKK